MGGGGDGGGGDGGGLGGGDGIGNVGGGSDGDSGGGGEGGMKLSTLGMHTESTPLKYVAGPPAATIRGMAATPAKALLVSAARRASTRTHDG